MSANHASAMLVDEQSRYRLLVDAITDYAIYMLDPDGVVVSWNAGAQRFKGYSADEIIGEHFSRFYTQEDRDAGLPARNLEIAGREGRFEKEGWRVRKDGAMFWANVIIDAVRDDDGNLIGFAKITRDISDKREAQLALEQARQELLQSQKLEAIGQLTGGVAHDFNNLLMAILGSLELAQKRMTADPNVSPLIANAVQAAQRGATLTQRMLAFARKQDLRPKAVDLPELVDGMMDLFRRSLGPSITVRTAFPPALEPILTDRHQLETALLNLIVNARDAMPDGGEVIISATNETIGAAASGPLKKGRYVCITVSDDGEGMDRETLGKAAEPFFTTKGIGKGTGLGLSMVHGLAHQSGGKLKLRSERGKGTSAEIWLPVAVASLTEQPSVTSSPGVLSSEFRPHVVIAVDDDALVLMNTVALLEDLGHTVYEATSAHEALSILEGHPDVDLVITDHAMPKMTGSQLAGIIHEERPELPVILATGYAELPPGGDAALPRLSKPFSQRQLQQIMARTFATVVR